MTDAQFTELMSKLDSLYLMVFVGLIVILLGIGWIAGGQR
ncbi:DUF2627 family protein [Vibrio fluvialis]|nr:DUF2627 family protein [Vibrio fluvialis]MBL4303852.1 DUF2627 family protein [Vibrio fluvialis]MBY7769588.1 DUF2627 family protein [Vibrio fluvialis]MBY8054224.1 DUF2627 family protein [Vibrio fluvialis]